jgi:hypothetical protein
MHAVEMSVTQVENRLVKDASLERPLYGTVRGDIVLQLPRSGP